MYCTLLASAQSEVEKSGIKAKMSSDPDLVRILKQLEGEGGEEVRLLKKKLCLSLFLMMLSKYQHF